MIKSIAREILRAHPFEDISHRHTFITRNSAIRRKLISEQTLLFVRALHYDDDVSDQYNECEDLLESLSIINVETCIYFETSVIINDILIAITNCNDGIVFVEIAEGSIPETHIERIFSVISYFLCSSSIRNGFGMTLVPGDTTDEDECPANFGAIVIECNEMDDCEKWAQNALDKNLTQLVVILSASPALYSHTCYISRRPT